jgi:hypothetical protein
VEDLALAGKAEIILTKAVAPAYEAQLAEGFTTQFVGLADEYTVHASAAATEKGITAYSEVAMQNLAEKIIEYDQERGVKS